MKRIYLIPLAIIVIVSLFIGSCAEPEPAPAPAPKPAPAPAPKPAPAPEPEPAPTPKPDEPQYGGTFSWVMNMGMATMGPPVDGGPMFGSHPMFEYLLRMDENGRLIPWLAKSWEIAPDKSSITLKLRDDVKFHDGTPFNAEAVKYNLEACLEANIWGSAILTKITSYDVLDEYTIRLNLAEFDSTLLMRLSQSNIGQMVSPTALQKEATEENIVELHSVGTGPFMFDSWARDDYVKMVKNPNYWQKGKPYLDELIMRNIMDVTVSIMAFKAGEVDMVENVDPVDAKQLESEGYDIKTAKMKFVHSVIPDSANPESPFADKRVRLAVEYAIDKEELCEGVGMGYYESLYQLACKDDAWYNPDLKPRMYDPDKARELLTEAGYAGGFKTTLNSDVRARRDTLVAVQTYLMEVGIETELDIADVPRAIEKERTGWEGLLFPGFPNSNNFIGIIARWGDANTFPSYLRPAGWQEIWDKIYAEPDDTKREAMLMDVYKLAYDECIAIPYQGDASIHVMQPGKVHNMIYHACYSIGWYPSMDIWLSD